MNRVKSNYKNLPEYSRSPFSHYEGETLVKNTLDYSSVYMDDINGIILLIINKYCFMTSILLTEALKNLGVEIEQNQVRNKLKRLAKAGYIDGYTFFSDGEHRSSNKVYKIGNRGRKFLMQNGIQPNLSKYLEDLTVDSVSVKKILSTVQFLVKNKLEPECFDVCKTVYVEGHTGAEAMIFRPQAIIQEEAGTILVESIRKNTPYKEDLINKVNRICSLLKLKDEANVRLGKNINLIFICEDYQHTNAVMDIIKLHYPSLPFKMQFTTDGMVYNEVETLYSIKSRILNMLFSA